MGAATFLAAIFHLGPILGPRLAPSHRFAANGAGFTGKSGLVTFEVSFHGRRAIVQISDLATSITTSRPPHSRPPVSSARWAATATTTLRNLASSSTSPTVWRAMAQPDWRASFAPLGQNADAASTIVPNVHCRAKNTPPQAKRKAWLAITV